MLLRATSYGKSAGCRSLQAGHWARPAAPPATVASVRRGICEFASVNGAPVDAASAAVSIWDLTFQRGDGVFEAMRCTPARGTTPAAPRALALHLDRLERSAAGIRFPLPERADLITWLRAAAAAGGANPGYLRLMLTRGTAPGYGDHLSSNGGAAAHAPPKTIIVWQPLPNESL